MESIPLQLQKQGDLNFYIIFMNACYWAVYRGTVGVTNQSVELSKFSGTTEATYV